MPRAFHTEPPTPRESTVARAAAGRLHRAIHRYPVGDPEVSLRTSPDGRDVLTLTIPHAAAEILSPSGVSVLEAEPVT